MIWSIPSSIRRIKVSRKGGYKSGNEYGQCAFQKIYDIDILNESSGASTDTIVLERQVTYIARRVSPMTKGVYQRENNGQVKGMPVVPAK